MRRICGLEPHQASEYLLVDRAKLIQRNFLGYLGPRMNVPAAQFVDLLNPLALLIE